MSTVTWHKGVFDFPWLKDGVISKLDQEYWNFEDIFSSPLEYDQIHTPTLSTTPAGARIEFSNFSWQCFYDETDPDKKHDQQSTQTSSMVDQRKSIKTILERNNHETAILDGRVLHLKDQLIRATVYLSLPATRNNPHFARELDCG